VLSVEEDSEEWVASAKETEPSFPTSPSAWMGKEDAVVVVLDAEVASGAGGPLTEVGTVRETGTGVREAVSSTGVGRTPLEEEAEEDEEYCSAGVDAGTTANDLGGEEERGAGAEARLQGGELLEKLL
jgi:hypothetical protein